MNRLSSILPTYTYGYFNDQNVLATKQLNFLQYIFRKLFGCYSETHLSNVVQKAYQLTLNNTLSSASDTNQLFQIMDKANRIYDDYYFNLPSYPLPSGENLRIGVSYLVAPRYNLEQDYKIRQIRFRLIFKGNHQNSDEYISVSKNTSCRLVASLPTMFKRHPNETPRSIQSRLLQENTRITMAVLAKILKDSAPPSNIFNAVLQFTVRALSSYPQLDQIWYRSEDYSRPFIIGAEEVIQNPEELNITKRNSMNNLGWVYENVDFRHFGEFIYVLKKENVENNPNIPHLNLDQKFSLAFVANYLDTSEYI